VSHGFNEQKGGRGTGETEREKEGERKKLSRGNSESLLNLSDFVSSVKQARNTRSASPQMCK
jgi:hypothetical protein